MFAFQLGVLFIACLVHAFRASFMPLSSCFRPSCACSACSKVDEAIRHFTPYLCEVATSGKAHTLKEGRLLQLIADNSLLYTDVVTKIGLLDISQTAWTQDK